LKTCRDELHAAKEQKNEMEQRYSDNLKEIETAKKDYDDVKKFCEVTVFLAQLYVIIAYFLNLPIT